MPNILIIQRMSGMGPLNKCKRKSKMNIQSGQSPCGELLLPREGTVPLSGATLEALARRGRCLQGQAIVEAAGAAWARVRAALDALRHYRQRRAAIAELSRLDDRLLADIGIHREQIPLMVDGMLARAAPGPDGQQTISRRAPVATTRTRDCAEPVNDEDCRSLAA